MSTPATPPPSEEATLTLILQAKMSQQGLFLENERQSLAYRISELMVAAKELYTKELEVLLREADPTEEGQLFEDLAGLRMALLHLRDLVTDFDEAFMDAMAELRDSESEGPEGEEEPQDEEDVDDDAEGEDEPESSEPSATEPPH